MICDNTGVNPFWGIIVWKRTRSFVSGSFFGFVQTKKCSCLVSLLCRKYGVVLYCCKKRRRYSKIMIVTVLEDDDEGDADIIRGLRKI